VQLVGRAVPVPPAIVNEAEFAAVNEHANVAIAVAVDGQKYKAAGSVQAKKEAVVGIVPTNPKQY